jgi:uncharacterized protein (TIGR03435 family)
MAKVNAELRAGKGPVRRKYGAHVDASQAEYDSMSLQDLIVNAYRVRVFQISGPDWLNDKRFDIVAKMPEGASIDDAPRLLQALLEDRFKLVVQFKNKEQQVMALEVDKGGPKLNAATANPQSFSASSPFPPINTPYGPVLLFNNGHVGCTLQSSKMTMAGLADLLTNLMQGGGGVAPGGGGGGFDWKIVSDQTGLQGEYSVTLDASLDCVTIETRADTLVIKTGPVAAVSKDMLQMWAAEQEQRHPSYIGAPDITDAPDPILFQSVQKLGLKLEVSKAPVEMLVVNHAEKNPTAN